MKRLLSIFVLVGVMVGQQSSLCDGGCMNQQSTAIPSPPHFDAQIREWRINPAWIQPASGCVIANSVNLDTEPCEPRYEWRVLPHYQKPHHFAFITQHPTRTKLSILGVGLFTGWAIWYWNHPHCNNYEYGQSGVNVWCPKDRR